MANAIIKKTLTPAECVFLYNALHTASQVYKDDSERPAFQRGNPHLVEQFKAQSAQAAELAEIFIACPQVVIEWEE